MHNHMNDSIQYKCFYAYDDKNKTFTWLYVASIISTASVLSGVGLTEEEAVQ